MPTKKAASFLATLTDPHSVITAIESGLRFPEVVPVMRDKYEAAIRQFATLVSVSTSSGDFWSEFAHLKFRRIGEWPC